MKKIAFLDTEININDRKIQDLGLVFDNQAFRNSSPAAIKEKLLNQNIAFICGHNFINHDKRFLSNTSFNSVFYNVSLIDTFYLSMLLFPYLTTHKLEKPYKTDINIENNPLKDAKQTQILFTYLDENFDQLKDEMKTLYLSLLYDNEYFKGYFEYKNLKTTEVDLFTLIKNENRLKDKIVCSRQEFLELCKENKIELAFILSWLYYENKPSEKQATSKMAISSAILMGFPKIYTILKRMTFALENINLEEFAENEFNITSFKSFKKAQSKQEQISQKDIILSALQGRSLLAILPTGGGKTFAFQLPALIKAKSYKGLSIVISPLQALMKNHIDGFKNKNNNFKIAAISGFLTPIERANTLNEIKNGSIDILYLAPEALRSNSVFAAIKCRFIERFIIDEAHCFSTWGHDFRHDYYFIAQTIRDLEELPFQEKIPVSCFTATAKPEVLKDIKDYLKKELDLEPEHFIASSQRDNLKYEVKAIEKAEYKYKELIQILKERFDKEGQKRKNPTIIYIPQNAGECKKLDKKLKEEPNLRHLNLCIEPFYSKLNEDIHDGKRQGRNKEEILQDFIENKIDIVIATTAFGMGIDKSNITTIIHYEQSDSLESYMQESGRGARDEHLEAKCIVLYHKDEFNQQFNRLKKTKLEYHEIIAVLNFLKRKKGWGIHNDAKFITPREIARGIGLDTEDSNKDYETIINTALLELEKNKIIKRGRNKTKIFATSINKKNNEMTMEAIREKLDQHRNFFQQRYKKIEIYEYMIRVMQIIIQKSKTDPIEIEVLADLAGVNQRHIFEVIYELQKLEFLEYKNDIDIFIKKDIKEELKIFFVLENQLLSKIKEKIPYKSLDLRENDDLDCKEKNKISTLKQIIQSWTFLLGVAEKQIFSAYFKKHICFFEFEKNKEQILQQEINLRQEVCLFVADELLQMVSKNEQEIEISSNQLKIQFEQRRQKEISLHFFHHCLVFLHDMIKNFKLRNGRLIYHTAYKIEKLKNDQELYKIEEAAPYQKRRDYNPNLKLYYERKIESIHILMAFLEKVLQQGWEKAKEMMTDYYIMAYKKFLTKYGFNEKFIKIAMTKERYENILKDLDENQKEVFEDKTSSAIMVLAGPGSGKTKTLSHKIASLLSIEQNKNEYFLMLAHSRTAVSEFRERVRNLIGDQVFGMRIFTFHSFALYLLGEKGGNENLQEIIEKATDALRNKEIELPHIQMLVLDEYQDVGSKSYELIKAIYENMSKNKKIIAVGDDDQCIKNFGEDPAKIEFISCFEHDFQEKPEKSEEEQDEYFIKVDTQTSAFKQYHLLKNYRSAKNIVELSNAFRKNFIKGGLKEQDLLSHNDEDGEITLTFYENSSLIKNIVDEVQKELLKKDINTIALLFRSNDEVLQAFSELLARRIEASHITDKDGFELGNLIELQDYLNFLQQKGEKFADKELQKRYGRSKNYHSARRVIEKFKRESKEDLQNDAGVAILFKEYLREITFDEFRINETKVIVSTMHKAKGREFDSVFIGVEDEFCKKQSEKYDTRLLYVALTRAKKALHIHTKNKKLKEQLKEYCNEVITYQRNDDQPDRICFLMGLSDIRLKDDSAQNMINNTNPVAGEKCTIKQINKKETIFFNIYKNNQRIATLSQPQNNRISTQILENAKRGYCLEQEAEIEYVVLWQDKQDKDEKTYKEILCQIFMSRQNSN